MPKIKVKVTVTDAEGCQLVIKIGDQTIDFEKGGTKEVTLDSRRYTAMLAGFQDPASTDPSIRVEFIQGTSRLTEITIKEPSFIKSLKVVVN